MAQSPENQQSRRDLLKKGAVGATVAGVVWQAPKVRGLSLRPDYAAAGTDSCVGTFSVIVSDHCGGDAINNTSPPLTPCSPGTVMGTFNAAGTGGVCLIDGSYSGSPINSGLTCNATFESGGGNWSATLPAWDQVGVTISVTGDC